MSLYDERTQYQADIIKEFAKIGIFEVGASEFDKNLAMNKNRLINFLKNTQKETLENINLSDDELCQKIADEIEKITLLEALKNGVSIKDKKINLMYRKDNIGINTKQKELYEQNEVSISQEIIAGESQNGKKQRVDLVLFVNGLAVVVIELKSNQSCQDYKKAINQYKCDRDPKLRLFRKGVGAIVFLAMDLDECHMCTELKGLESKFLPFNKGKRVADGVCRAGNDNVSGKISKVWYVWEEVLNKDSLIELIDDIIFVDNKANVIFPRYHQLDLLNKIRDDINASDTYKNYLIQHSAGSGKTKSIAWLSYALAKFYKNGKAHFDSVIIVTDRKVVDKQLQDEINQLAHKDGYVATMDESKNSSDLREVIEENTKIIVSTIQKFSYIKDDLKNSLSDKKFAVIIDEAHSSTSGADMEAVLMSLKSDFKGSKNISIFGFTATPKATTLQNFGTKDEIGQYKAFHIYSMEQAIEEGYILNVLDNYTTYDTFFRLHSADDNKEVSVKEARKQIATIIKNNKDIIEQKIAIIANNFASVISPKLDKNAKAMVVCEDIESVIRYFRAFCEYCKNNGFEDFKPLIAFSGEKTLSDSGEVLSESGINEISENALPKEFDKKERRILFVANKYQTGFDQDKLVAMYVLKKLNGINAVQTLSRLNRICPQYPDKTTFVLDFENSYEEIEEAFAPYFRYTILNKDIGLKDLVETYEKINGYNILLIRDENIVADNIRAKSGYSDIKTIFDGVKDRILTLEDKKINNFKALLENYVRTYEFLKIVLSDDMNENLTNRYLFVKNFLKEFKVDNEEVNICEMIGDIEVKNVRIIENEKIQKPNIIPEPYIEGSENFGALKAKKNSIRILKEILDEINNKMSNFEKNQNIQATMEISNALLNNQNLKSKAKSENIDDFSIVFESEVENTISSCENYDKYELFYGYLLKNSYDRNRLFGAVKDDIYASL